MGPWASSELPSSRGKRWLVPTVHQRCSVCSCHLHTGPLGTERGSSIAVLHGSSLCCTGVRVCVARRAAKGGAGRRKAPALSAVLVRGRGGDREAV